MIEPKGRGVLDTPLEPVIGLAGGETRWRSMTAECTLRENPFVIIKNNVGIGRAGTSLR